MAYADNVPMFYSPFIYKSLAKRRVVIQFQPGHDDVNGNFLKTLTTLRFTDRIYDKVYYDHYSEQGNGLGNEFNYSVPGKMQGSLFGYYINPHGNAALAGALTAPQYNFRAYHWQRLDPATTLQSNVNLRKNVSFNNQYFAQDTNQSVNDIISSVALTRQKSHFNHRLVVERDDAPDPGDTSAFATTHVQSASYPRYDITLYQIPLWSAAQTALTPGTTMQVFPHVTRERMGPLNLSATGSFGNTYKRLDDQYHPNASGSFTLSEAILLSRQFSFNPSLTPALRWQEKFDAQPPPPTSSTMPVSTVGLFRGVQGRLGTADTLRWRPLSSFTLDQTYSLTARLEPNGTAIDRGGSDGGLETHHLGWLAFWRPTRRVMLRSFAGADIRRLANEDPNAYFQRKWDPWTTEFTYDPTLHTGYFFRYAMGYYPIRVQLWEADYTYKGAYRTYFREGVLFNSGTRGLLTWNNTFGIFLSPGWRVDATIHTFVSNRSVSTAIREGRLIDEEIIVTRDLHCWEAQFSYRNLPPFSRQYSLMFNFKIGVAAQKQITNEDLESQYYPWRDRPYAR